MDFATTNRPRLGEPTPPAAPNVDARALATELKREIEGEVRFGTGDRALYANDPSVYRQVPIEIVVPKSVDDGLLIDESMMDKAKEKGLVDKADEVIEKL